MNEGDSEETTVSDSTAVNQSIANNNNNNSIDARGGGDDDNNNVNEKHYELDDINFPLQYLQNASSKKKHPVKIEQQLKELSEKVKESVDLTLAALDTQNDIMRNMFLYCLGRNLNDVFGKDSPECLNCYFFNQGREYYAENKDELQNIYNNLHRNHNTTTTGEIDGCGIGNSSYTIKLLRAYREAGAIGTVNFTSNYTTSLEEAVNLLSREEANTHVVTGAKLKVTVTQDNKEKVESLLDNKSLPSLSCGTKVMAFIPDGDDSSFNGVPGTLKKICNNRERFNIHFTSDGLVHEVCRELFHPLEEFTLFGDNQRDLIKLLIDDPDEVLVIEPEVRSCIEAKRQLLYHPFDQEEGTENFELPLVLLQTKARKDESRNDRGHAVQCTYESIPMLHLHPSGKHVMICKDTEGQNGIVSTSILSEMALVNLIVVALDYNTSMGDEILTCKQLALAMHYVLLECGYVEKTYTLNKCIEYKDYTLGESTVKIENNEDHSKNLIKAVDDKISDISANNIPTPKIPFDYNVNKLQTLIESVTKRQDNEVRGAGEKEEGGDEAPSLRPRKAKNRVSEAGKGGEGGEGASPVHKGKKRKKPTSTQGSPSGGRKAAVCPACESLRETVGDLLARVADLEMKLKGVEDKNTAS